VHLGRAPPQERWTESNLAATSAGRQMEQLARALDYRRWHRFRVERWQDVAVGGDSVF